MLKGPTVNQLPNQNIETYTRRGCVGCCKCEGGGRNVARTTVLWCLGLFTCGIGLVVLPLSRRCVYCGHNMFMNAHRPHTVA